MSPHKWYVACVRSCQERKVAERLSVSGFEVYVPIQKVRRRWSDRVKMVDKLLLSGMVFIRCSEENRKSVFDITYGVTFFLMDKTSSKEHTPLVVPDVQMGDFMRVVRALNGEDEISVVTSQVAPGDMVRVVRGPLTGMVCECAEVQNRHHLVIRLGILGSALVTVDAGDVVKA